MWAPRCLPNCTPGYSPCLTPASDYDCAGGSGNGPGYTGLVYVTVNLTVDILYSVLDPRIRYD